MNDAVQLYAEYVSLGHPDRLADAVAERIVDAAVAMDSDALVGVEVAVHTDKVFVDGRVAARGAEAGMPVEQIVRGAYAAAGYGGPWRPDPKAIVVTTDLCLETLGDDERAARCVSDDQSVVTGYACRDTHTSHLPVAHYVAHRLGWALGEAARGDLDGPFGPDFKLLVHLALETDAIGRTRHRWQRLTASVMHAPGIGYEEQHRRLVPVLQAECGRLEAEGLEGVGTTFAPGVVVLNGAGDFVVGGPEGDNGLSGKKLAVDFYGPSVPIGGGAMCGKDPHKVDRSSALRARQLARRLVADNSASEARVALGWSPGESSPYMVVAERRVAGDATWRQVPDADLPPSDWFSIDTTFRDLELHAVRWSRILARGYFLSPAAPWER